MNLKLLAATLPILAITSCGLRHTVQEAGPTEFLTTTASNTSTRFPRLPFRHSWRDPSVKMDGYKNIVVRPVTIKYLREDKWENSKSEEIPSLEAYRQKTETLARHFTKRLNVAFSDPICIFYKTTDTSKPKTAILEVALVEVYYPKPSSVAPLDIPICAFEARVTDAKTGKVIVTAADKRGPDLHISGDNTHFSTNEEICSIWARQLMEASNKEIFATVRRDLIKLEEER